MTNNKQKIPPILRLKYKKGELIIKEGDYGISLYRIINGKVQLFNESVDRDIDIGKLRSGDIFGEMAFLNRGKEPRRASARALKDTELEVWHPERFLKEYEKIPAIIRFMANQTFRHLMRMNRLVSQLSGEKQRKQEKEKAKRIESVSTKRSFYRKEVDLECVYRRIGISYKSSLTGRIKDISLSGLGLEVSGTKVRDSIYKPGHEYFIETTLPNGKDLGLRSRIMSIDKGESRSPGRLYLGMSFIDLPDDARSILGFFLMP